MKGTFVTLSLKSLVTMFFLLGGLFLAANRAEAQSLNWMTEAQALTALENSINQKVLDQSNYTQGSTPWLNLNNYIQYHKLIYITIEEGATVPAAVETGLDMLNAKSAGDEFLPKTLLQQLRDDAIDLLTL